ncbi:hypothetical protein BZG02_14345 [Labilibaculum filiforme]|uniref:Uncharacterized protein n=2 Tax=Labilibaculum filiforme TaxID=1940526 RepID=A0A2N3HUR4_9BACT|nr:hypothetical protein BZG02_14345 [Labilibaculum filiforme]
MLIPFSFILVVQGQTSLHRSCSVSRKPAQQHLVLLDGEKYSDPEFMHSIDAGTIYKLEVLKGYDVQFYVDKYGELARIGIITIQTKSFVAKGWYDRFAKHQEEINDIVQKEKFDYKEYRAFVNDELLDNEYLETWEPLLENKQITNVSFESIESDEVKGEIRVTCKAQEEEK